MTSKIRVLTDHTINQIAAGEVIENPASVVKELVENSLDAGATDITVEIKGGGRQLIRVTDNGCGMGPDDALLCLERHATSKLRTLEDLDSIGTMGFRGEAIPSIASISKLTLLTCLQSGESELGTMVIVDGGKIVRYCPAACPKGTTIEVKSIFYNVPVRKKFQRSPTYDSNEILKMMSLLALGYPEIRFKLISNQEVVLSTPASIHHTFDQQLSERIETVLGKDFSESLCPLEASQGDYQLQGFIGKPFFSKQNRTGQYLFINKRHVFSPYLAYAIREGFGPTLGTQRYPVFVLHLRMPGSLVDVNVHPQKKEVRLRQEYSLKQMIIQSVEQALQSTGSSPFCEITPFQFSPAMPVEIPRNEWNPTFAPLKVCESVEPYLAYPPPPSLSPKPAVSQPSLFQAVKTAPKIPKAIATIVNYIIVDESHTDLAVNGLSLVDQRAAHSRIIFDRLMKQETKNSVQTLLIPHTFETIPAESALLRQHLEQLNAMGISIREFGPNTFSVDALPEIFGNTDVQSFLNEIMERLKDEKNEKLFRQEQEKQIALAASRTAVSRNRKLSLDEAQLLLNQLMPCETPYQCPLGKPTFCRLSSEEIAKLFSKF
jgi:DNA mismatch repair protein MutL